MLQLLRLESALRLGAEQVASGDISAIGPYLAVLDRLDRYRRRAAPLQAYDKAARDRLFAKLNSLANRLLEGTEPKPPEAQGGSQGAGAAPESNGRFLSIRPQAPEKSGFAEEKSLDFASRALDFLASGFGFSFRWVLEFLQSRMLAAILR